MASACALMFSKSIPEKQKFDHVPVRYLVEIKEIMRSYLTIVWHRYSLNQV